MELLQTGSAAGYQVGQPQLQSETDYIILAKAVGKGGKTTLVKHTFRTDGYLTDAVWKSAGTADMECGLFTSIADPCTTTGIEVEKMVGRDIFRLVDPSASLTSGGFRRQRKTPVRTESSEQNPSHCKTLRYFAGGFAICRKGCIFALPYGTN